MKLFVKKSVVVVCILAMMLSWLPVFTIETQAASSKMTLAELQAKFPHGKYWNHTVGGKNNPDGYTSTPCKHHSGTVPCSHADCAGSGGCCLYGQCACNSYANAIQCMGFAFKLGYDAFGSNPRSWTMVYSLNNLKAGDIVRYNGHSIFVTAVNGNTITFADCNYFGKCQIRWNQTITKSKIKNFVHVHSAPATLDKTLTINYHTNGGAIDSPDFYISSSMIYNKSTDTIAKRTLTYGQTHPNGLHNDTTFGLYREGYTFLGWSLSASGGDIISPNTSFAPESIVPELSNGSMTATVYAVWEANTPPVIDKTVESIAISSVPAKSIYYVGESLNQSGISIIAKHTDGSYSKVTEGFTCSPSVFTSEGTQTVTVNYSGKTATYSVQVTKAKEQVNNATAKVDSVGHHSPSLTSNMFPVGAYANDKIQVFCKNGDFYLCLIPWGEDTTTISCGAIMYIDVADVTLNSEVPDATEFFTMNPTQTNNAVANIATKLYWKANLQPITYDGNEIAPHNIAAGTAVKVLFEMNGNYCVESDGYIGFADKSHFTLNSTARGLQLNKNEIDAIYGETISTEGLTVEKVMSDGTTIAISNYSSNLPPTDSLGTKYALITADGFSEYIKINVAQPTIKIANAPQKNAYYLEESFDTTGLKVVSVAPNGKETDITSQISLSYDFSEVGNKSVTISYAGAKAYVPVLVYSQPLVELADVTGYQGQTVTLPIYYYDTCEYTFPNSFKMEISYDNTKLEYVSAHIPSLTQNGQMIVNSNMPGKLIITYADPSVINDGDIMQNIKFAIRSLNTSSEDIASVEVTKLELYDSSGKKFESEIINGQIHTAGKLLVSYYSDGTLVASSYKNYGESVSIIEMIPTKDGYTFLGWSASSENSIPQYYANDTFDCYEHTTLYAVWKTNEYAVNYNANGGSGTMIGDTVTQGGTFTLENCTFEAPDGYRFKAWAIGSVNGEQKQPDQTITITAETNIYAIWEEIPHTCVGVLQSGQGTTCTVDGWNDYYKCSCGKLYAEAACTNEITDLAVWKAGAGKIAASHSYNTTWRFDGTNHWKECSCGEISELSAHAYVDDNCECGKTGPNYTLDSDESGTENLGTDDPQTPDDNDGLSTGAIVGITAGSVAILGGGGFTLWWFVFKRKLF